MLSRWSAEKNGKGHQMHLLALQKPDAADRSGPCKRAGERAAQAPCPWVFTGPAGAAPVALVHRLQQSRLFHHPG